MAKNKNRDRQKQQHRPAQGGDVQNPGADRPMDEENPGTSAKRKNKPLGHN
ncbi:hypothetical protein GCM10023347_21240 [Streptomyces chumphonensis]|uniref:Small acid-soluble spore protein P n=1 Tax=Streptomyces chumphonensis TaxID=1214925 RepID=A0A927IAX3_9ACTN|nr:hypothetical protein [Streptomyces chumphonensis]MBD3930210.1 hypothetical protein [Streptomyces chumphonensis]